MLAFSGYRRNYFQAVSRNVALKGMKAVLGSTSQASQLCSSRRLGVG